MTTLENAIVIDDDDGNDNNGAEMNNKEREAMKTFMEVLEVNDEEFAWKKLKEVGFNVELAISKGLDRSISASGKICSQNEVGSPLHEMSQTSTPANDPLSPSLKKISSYESNATDFKHWTRNLSEHWRECYQKSAIPFVDPDFPPTRMSLDGRKENRKIFLSSSDKNEGKNSSDKNTMALGSMSNKDTILCLCKLPASARTVQSDGPNYGRFYLACGQQNGRRRWQRQSDDDKLDDVNVINQKVGNEGSEKTSNVHKPQLVNPYRKRSADSKKGTATNPIPTNQKPCNFFQWDDDGSKGSSMSGYRTTIWSRLTWHHFGDDTNSVLYHRSIGPDQVRQGAVGNCWFLSALAVVAEKPYLVRKLFPHDENINDKGVYQVNFCLDGKWTPIVVDSYLPVVHGEQQQKESSARTATTLLAKQQFRGGTALSGGTTMVYPAFCAVPRGQLWPALVEKAYAKAHTSYSRLSGGFIAEGLADMTGAPTETIVLESYLKDDDFLWTRLMSFAEAGFLLGVATNRGGDGLVGGHAYSIMSVREIHDSFVGEQQLVTDFFAPLSKRPKLSQGIEQAATSNGTGKVGRAPTSVRLVRIRNPWGKREWKGAFSVNSETWTNNLRRLIGEDAWAKNDGTFWMQFEDMCTRFHHMDVCKTREGWFHSSVEGCFYPKDAIMSSKFVYFLSCSERTWSFISIIQPKKRAHTTTRYWYADPSMVILKKRRNGARKDNELEWTCEACSCVGVTRSNDIELFLDPEYDYCVVPFAGVPFHSSGSFPFRLTAYSASKVEIQFQPEETTNHQRLVAVSELHNNLLGDEGRLVYRVSTRCALVCIHKRGCLYFIAINGSRDTFLSIRIKVRQEQGLIFSSGRNGDTHGIPATSQKIVLVVCTAGKSSSNTTELAFNYVSDAERRGCNLNRVAHSKQNFSLTRSVDITISGDLASSLVPSEAVVDKGGDTVDIFSWIPQLGAMVS